MKKKTKKVPKGTSEYQAAWIIEEEGEEEEGLDNDNQEDGNLDDQDMDEFLPPEEDEEEEDESGCEAEEDVEDMEEAVSEAGNREDYDAKHVNFR